MIVYLHMTISNKPERKKASSKKECGHIKQNKIKVRMWTNTTTTTGLKWILKVYKHSTKRRWDSKFIFQLTRILHDPCQCRPKYPAPPDQDKIFARRSIERCDLLFWPLLRRMFFLQNYLHLNRYFKYTWKSSFPKFISMTHTLPLKPHYHKKHQ